MLSAITNQAKPFFYYSLKQCGCLKAIAIQTYRLGHFNRLLRYLPKNKLVKCFHFVLQNH